jgi:hypothetical protein
MLKDFRSCSRSTDVDIGDEIGLSSMAFAIELEMEDEDLFDEGSHASHRHDESASSIDSRHSSRRPSCSSSPTSSCVTLWLTPEKSSWNMKRTQDKASLISNSNHSDTSFSSNMISPTNQGLQHSKQQQSSNSNPSSSFFSGRADSDVKIQ